jgi:hypothetical protein
LIGVKKKKAWQILSILRNLSLTSPNEQEMAYHFACVDLLVKYLLHPKPKFVRESLETLGQLSPFLILSVEEGNDASSSLNIETTRDFLECLSVLLTGRLVSSSLLLCSVLTYLTSNSETAAAIKVLANITKKKVNRTVVESILGSADLVERLTELFSNGLDPVVDNTLKVV